MTTSATKQPVKGPSKRSGLGISRAEARRETIAAYLFLLPFLIVFVGFVLIPMVMCLWTSFAG